MNDAYLMLLVSVTLALAVFLPSRWKQIYRSLVIAGFLVSAW